MTARLDASVIIPARAADSVIERQLQCLAEQDHPSFEVIIAYNGRSPGLRDVAATWRDHLDVRVVDATARIGCGPARNVGVWAARTDSLLFCDAGDRVAPTWVGAFTDALEEFGLVTGPKAAVGASEVAGSAWRDVLRTATYSTSPNTAGSRPYASGGNAGYRREVLAAIGGFGSHNLRREDVEASWLAQDRGHELGWAPEARLLYVARSGAAARWRQSFGYGAGLEALRRQVDPSGSLVRPLRTTAKVAAVRSARHPAQAPAALGGVAGQIAERVLPGRYVERVRARAAAEDERARTLDP